MLRIKIKAKKSNRVYIKSRFSEHRDLYSRRTLLRVNLVWEFNGPKGAMLLSFTAEEVAAPHM